MLFGLQESGTTLIIQTSINLVPRVKSVIFVWFMPKVVYILLHFYIITRYIFLNLLINYSQLQDLDIVGY